MSAARFALDLPFSSEDEHLVYQMRGSTHAAGTIIPTGHVSTDDDERLRMDLGKGG